MKREIMPIDYITKDFEGFKRLMMEKIPLHAPEWTDHSENDMGIVLLELLAYGLDVLGYYQDKAFNENLLPTAKSRKSVIRLCRLLGYELTPQTPAQHKIEITKSADYWDKEIVIPAKTKISTDPTIGSPVVFELDKDVIIPASADESTAVLTGEGTATHGEWIQEMDVLGTGDSTPSQKFKLTHEDVILESLQIMTEDKYLWTKVDDFVSSSKDDRHFIAYVDEDNFVTVEMGSGKTGAVVPTNHLVTAMYRTGGGEVGNVGLNTINTFVDTDFEGIASLTNPEQPIRVGRDSEDIETAKKNAPRQYRVSDRAVTPQDFEDMCMNYDGVLKAVCKETFNLNGDLHIHIVPDNHELITTEELATLKDNLLAHINKRKLVHDKPILNPNGDDVYQSVDISVNVTTSKLYRNSDIQANVEGALLEAFAIEEMNFGENIPLASIFKVVMSVKGVEDVDVVTPTASVEVPEGEILEDGTIVHPKIAVLGTVLANVTGGV